MEINIKNIVKRDGRIQPFDPARIENAILKAFKATKEVSSRHTYFTDEDAAREVTDEVCTRLIQNLYKDRFPATGIEDQSLMIEPDDQYRRPATGDRRPTVEQVQDLVEEALMHKGYCKTAKAYIVYREQHRQMREMKSLVSIDLIDAYLNEADWRIKENANTTYSIQAMNNYIAGTAAAHYWLEKLYSIEVRQAHINGDMHIHDLDRISSYCIGWDIRELLTEGFKGQDGRMESMPPKHFRSALGQVVNYLYTLQNESSGAQALSNVDTMLAPFIAYDGLTYPEVKQAVQEWVFNLNVPTRAAGQVPFTNITLDLKVPRFMAGEPSVIGGKPAAPLGSFQKEVDMFNQAFAEVLLEGDARQRGFTFPIPTYNIGNWIIDPDEPEVWNEVILKVFEVAAKYGAPYFANFFNSELSPEDVRSMCCRLKLDTRELVRRGGGLFGSNPLTGSIGVVTINLPLLGYLAKDEADFLNRLAHVASLAVESLEIKRKVLERLTTDGLYPYSRHYLRDIKRRFNKYWANHFSTIGVLGGNEACLNLLGESIASRRGKEFMTQVLGFLRDFIVNVQERTGNMYNLEATPAEGCSHRLARTDKAKYPDIIVANEEAWKKGAPPYYTNSTMLPVNYTDDIYELLAHQEGLQTLYTGGTVTHVFLGEKKPDYQALARLTCKIFKQFKIPYLSLTPTYSVCPFHGYFPGEKWICPECGSQMEVYSRVVGYYRPVQHWNDGKREEFKDRKMFQVEGTLVGRRSSGLKNE
jgi:ribonucleoside-triphosphate reductase